MLIKSIRRSLVVTTVLSLTTLLTPVLVYAVPDVGAPKIVLAMDCGSNQNCFTDTADMLAWIWDTRDPAQTNPLIVDVDPGTYVLPDNIRFCENAGHVTVRGSGRDNTVLTGGGGFNAYAVINVVNCENLVFQDLTIRAGIRSSESLSLSRNGIHWDGGGFSTWNNILVEGALYGWRDVCTASSTPGTHYWFSSKVEAADDSYLAAYASSCGETWFYGGEIAAIADGGNAGSTVQLAVWAGSVDGDVRLFGTTVRAIATENNTAGTTSVEFVFGHVGLFANGGGTIHMHGGIVVAQSLNSAVDRNVTGVKTSDFSGGGFIHTPETAFSLQASGTGTASRIIGTNVQSPYLWPNGNDVPQIVSTNGSDIFVENDCDNASEKCDGTGTVHPHLMAYDDACNANGPWFDIARNKCRGEP